MGLVIIVLPFKILPWPPRSSAWAGIQYIRAARLPFDKRDPASGVKLLVGNSLLLWLSYPARNLSTVTVINRSQSTRHTEACHWQCDVISLSLHTPIHPKTARARPWQPFRRLTRSPDLPEFRAEWQYIT
ncbi:hypothetical protein BJV78DRAFT_1214427 [Lactifluus subvellereus]|nr:hypothetical protein BJV78DRAFT_1214427 [Lactifluus subvellereus]